MSLEKKIYENRRIKITYKISQFKIIFIVFLVLFLYYKTKRKKNSFVFSFQFDFFFFLNFYRGILFYCLNILCEMSFFCFSLKVKKVNFDDIFLIFFSFHFGWWNPSQIFMSEIFFFLLLCCFMICLDKLVLKTCNHEL